MRLYADGHVMRERGFVGGQVERRGRVVADGDVIRMAVQPVLPEGEDNLWTEAANLKHQTSNDFVLIGLHESVGMVVVVPTGHPRIAVAQHIVAPDAQLLDGLGEFGTPDFTDGVAGRGTGLSDLAEFTGRCGDQSRRRAACGMHRDGSADGESLVVRVGKQYQQAMVWHDARSDSVETTGANARPPLFCESRDCVPSQSLPGLRG